MATKSNSDRSEAIHSSNFACVSALKRRDTADLDRPLPALAGTPASGSRTARPNLRVAPMVAGFIRAMLITIPSQSGHVFVHHMRQAFDARHQAELLETFRQRAIGVFDKRRPVGRGGQSTGGCGRCLHGVASFLVSSPRAYGSGEATPPFFKVSTPAGTSPPVLRS